MFILFYLAHWGFVLELGPWEFWDEVTLKFGNARIYGEAEMSLC